MPLSLKEVATETPMDLLISELIYCTTSHDAGLNSDQFVTYTTSEEDTRVARFFS